MSGSSTGFGYNESQSESVDMTPYQFAGLRGPVAQGIQSLISSGGGPGWGGPFAAPMGQNEQQALTQMQGFASNPSAGEQATRDYLASSIRGDLSDPNLNPGLQSVLTQGKREISDWLGQQELGNRALFSRSGQQISESSPFSEAQARVGESAANAVGDFVGNTLYRGYNDAQNQRMQAAQAQRGLDQFNFDRASANLQAQALPRMIEQQGITGAIDDFRMRQQMLAQILGLGGQLGSPTLGQDASSFGISGSQSVG